MQVEFTKFKIKVSQRADLRRCTDLAHLAMKLNETTLDRADLPNLLVLMDWIISIPLSNAGTVPSQTLLSRSLNIFKTLSFCLALCHRKLAA